MKWAWVLLGLVLAPLLAWGQVTRVDPPGLAATIAGRVCEDLDGDGQCGGDEPGLANIRLVLATGREVRTDAQGRYHFTGVDARTPDATGGLHLRPGRHRVRVDPRTLPASSRVSPEGATVEVPWGAVVLQDFTVRSLTPKVKPVTPDYAKAPPEAQVAPTGVLFVVTGQASPGDSVTVAGVTATVDASGAYHAIVPVRPGSNELSITATAPGGTVRLFRQRIDVVERGGGWLVVPRAIEPTGSVQLPGGKDAPAASGQSSLRLEAPAGTTVRTPQGEVRVGAEGVAQVPVTLTPGKNVVPLELERPGEPVRTEQVEIAAEPRPFAVGLLDVEGSYHFGGGFELRGRGAAHGEAQVGALHLVGELDLRDTDVRTLRHEDAVSWLRPRLPERFERWPDPDLAVAEWGDNSVGLTPNASEGRLRLEVTHDTYGRAGFGTYRALQADGEVGRYHRPLFGPYAELHTGEGPLRVGLDAFAGSLADPTRQLSAVPAHEEFPATGGSLYYLGAPVVAEGSEVVRVELRDGLTDLPLAELHLVRGTDYEIDYLSGRVLLARPLTFMVGEPWLPTGTLTEAPAPVLVVDYAALHTGDARDSVGGEAWVEWGSHGRVSLSGVRERRDGAPYELLSGKARGTLGRYTLLAEVARSRGLALTAESYGVSDDGGLSFLRPSGTAFSDGGDALTLRLRGPGLWDKGSVDAAFRRRTQGFSDGAHVDTLPFRQFSLRATQPVGPFHVTLLADDKHAVDPRLPFSEVPYAARTLGASVGYERKAWGVALDVRDARLEAAELPDEGTLLTGGRTSVGLSGHLRLSDVLTLSAGHRQNVSERGDGPGRVDDTFTSAGVDVELDEDTRVGVRGGWGPALGPQVWTHASVKRGQDVYYGGYSVDVDGPDFGAGRAVTGARTDVADGTSVFVEDVSAHDTTSVREARAVGFQQTVFGALHVGARYERGVRSPLDIPSPLKRDVGAVTAGLVLERFRVDARAELRHERGQTVLGEPTQVDRTQVVLALASEVNPREDVTVSGRLNFARTGGRDGLEARLLEGYAGVAWRPGPWLLVARYGVTRELAPGSREVFGDRAIQIFSLLPAWHASDRLSVAAGLHGARSSLGDAVVWTWTGSLRPTVRVVGGLETGVEVARRTSEAVDESLTAVRVELGYRFDDRFRVAAGYTLLGFSGLGLPGERDSDRLYLRAEMAY